MMQAVMRTLLLPNFGRFMSASSSRLGGIIGPVSIGVSTFALDVENGVKAAGVRFKNCYSSP
jgi:hypothetical protein